MGQIEIRAWDKVHKEMRSFEWLCVNKILFGNLAVYNEEKEDSDFEFMLYIRHKDKNKEKIYEDDILKDSYGNIYLANMKLTIDESNVEIIGNKFENPELFNK